MLLCLQTIGLAAAGWFQIFHPMTFGLEVHLLPAVRRKTDCVWSAMIGQLFRPGGGEQKHQEQGDTRAQSHPFLLLDEELNKHF